MPRPYYSDTFLEDVKFKKWVDQSIDDRDLEEKLQQNGFTHLFVRHSLLEYNLEPKQRMKVREFFEHEAQMIFRHGDYTVWAVSPVLGKIGEDLRNLRPPETQRSPKP